MADNLFSYGTLIAEVVALFLAACVIFFLVWRVAEHFKVGKARRGHGTPIRISLVRAERVLHHEEQQLLSLKMQLEQLGAIELGWFAVKEMPGTVLCAYLIPDFSCVAILYDHPAAEVWFEIVTRYADGSSATFTTVKVPPAVMVPGDLTLRDPTSTIREALERLVSERRPGPFHHWDADNFVETFERAYARYLDYVIKQGGVSSSFIRDSVKALGSNRQFSNEEYELAIEKQNKYLRVLTSEACLDNFASYSNIPESDRGTWCDRLVAVHKRLTFAEVVIYFPKLFLDQGGDSGLIPLSDVTPEDPLALFDELNELSAEEDRYLRIGEVSEPLVARIYIRRQ